MNEHYEPKIPSITRSESSTSAVNLGAVALLGNWWFDDVLPTSEMNRGVFAMVLGFPVQLLHVENH